MKKTSIKGIQDLWVGKGIHWELCKRLKFDHTTKWFMHQPESILENETRENSLIF